MLKGGLLPSPVIVPLSSNPLALKNKIDTQTFIELRSDVPNVKIYFTVDGSKPDPFQINRTGTTSTNLYRGAFRLGTGKRIVKAVALTNHGSRESHVTTKYFDVNDIYTEEYVDNDQSLPDQQQQSFQPDFDRSLWNEAFNLERPISPRENWIELSYECSKEPIPEVEKLRIPSVQMQDLTHEEETFWERKSKPLSPGNGNWKRTMEHIFLNVYQLVKNEPQLRELFGWKIFGRIETACLIDKGGSYQILTTFKKPLGEQTISEEPPVYIRKSHGKRRSKKRTRTPPDVEQEKSYRHEKSIDEEKTPKIYTVEIEEQGTLVPFPDFNVDQDCDSIRKAIKSSHTDEQVLIEILGNRSKDQRMKIRDKYQNLFNRDLEYDLKDDTSKSFRKLIKNLLYSSVEYDCHEVQRAIKGLATDEEVLIEIFTTRSNKRLKAIHNLYPKLFDEILEKDIANNTNGPIKRLLLALIENPRPDSNEINEVEVKKDAKSLYQAGDQKWGTDESKFIQILCKRSDVQLKAIFEAYGRVSEHDIEEDIRSETSGTLRKGLLALVRIMRNRPGFFAHRIKNALQGANTNEDDLNRVIISRCEIDMIQIKTEYENIMRCSLDEHIEKDTNDDYQEILLELIKDPTKRKQKREKRKTRSRSSTPEQPKIYREETIHQGTMIPAANFDANRDVDALRKAMKGAGTDEKIIINILGNRTTDQRLEIKNLYKTKLNRDLVADLHSETSGQFRNLLERFMMDPIELDCFELKHAVKGAGTDEQALIEILASRSNRRIRKINETYRKMYSKPLEKDISSDTSGDFRRLLIALLQGNRPETIDVNKNEIREDAQSFMNADTNRFKGDDARFNQLFCERSDAQLKCILEEFGNLTGKSIEETIKKETKGDHQNALLALVRCLQSRPHFFAQQLRNAVKGLGTKESTLNRIIITRSEIDLVQIKLAYKNLFNRDLERDVRSDTSGDYEKLLLEILKDPSQRS